MAQSWTSRTAAASEDLDRPALEMLGVNHWFGPLHALRDVHLQVGRGEVIAVVGESGSGKTTLLRCFNQMVRPSGVVRVHGQTVAELDPIPLRRRIGYVPQEGGLMPHWSIRRNAALVARLRGDPDADTRAGAAPSSGSAAG
jgi:osmoprotectant transport system ATP-binding protein